MKASVTAHRDYRIATIDDRLLRRVPRTPRPRRLHRHLRARASDRRRQRHARATSSISCANSTFRSCAIPAAISCPPTIGRTASARARSARPGSTWPGIPRNRTRSACMNSPHWCEAAGTEMMLAINLGSRGLDEARNFVEYVNGPTGSYWGDLRKANGRAEPFARQALVPRQRDGRAVAGRPQDGARVWPARQRGRQDAAGLRQVARTDRLRLVQLRHGDLSGMGASRARALPTTPSTTSPCICISTTGPRTRPNISRSARSSTPISGPSPRPSISSAP